MIVKNKRLECGWSQEQLAEMSALSVRTIQRIEKGGNADIESLKSLAAVFELELSELQKEYGEIAEEAFRYDKEKVRKYVIARKS